jgi:DNA-binding LytR/AlgR family response regulator
MSNQIDTGFDAQGLPTSLKKSFLVCKRNKYLTVRTENIAFFHVRNEYTVIVTFDKQEYLVSYSLEHIQGLLCRQQFFRLNRQCLINFGAIVEIERYFSRKLLVKPAIPFPEKLLVSREKASLFLGWLEHR